MTARMRTSPGTAAGRSERPALPDRVRGSALFADIAGFTPLTEALANELGPQRGAEELTANIGRVFHAVIDELDALRRQRHLLRGRRHHLLDRRRRRRPGVRRGARRCRRRSARTGADRHARRHRGPARDEGRSRGRRRAPVRRRRPGHPADRRPRRAAHRRPRRGGAPRREGRGRARSVGGGVPRRTASCSATLRDDEISGRDVRGRPRPARGRGAASPATSRRRSPRSSSGRGCCPRSTSGCGPAAASSWPSSGRPSRCSSASAASTTTTTTTRSRSSTTFVRRAQRIMTGYGGNVLQLTLGDKGAYLYGVFGSPLAHEDDAARAAAAALELRDLEQTTAAREIQVGMTQGRLRSGTYGHEMRRTFVCLGDAVNLAARLMSAAPRERIFVAGPVREAAGEAFIWERLPDLKVKGKAEPGRGLVAERIARAGLAPQDPVRARPRRAPAGARGARGSAGRCDRRAGPGRRHRGRGRHGQVPAGRGVRAQRPPARPHRRVRRVPGVRHEHAATSSGARSGAACSGSRTRTPTSGRSRLSSAGSRRSTRPRCARAAAGARASGCRSPTRT